MKYDVCSLEARVCKLEKERERNRRTIKQLQDEISSCKRRINESGDYINEEVEEPPILRKCGHVGTWKKLIVLELRGENICLRM
jgi:wobble nucleotide-excising tRNase